MSPLLWLGAALGGAYVYKKKPQYLPAFLQPKGHAAKVAALGKVTATSNPTPSATAGLDPNMASAEVAAANGLLQNSVDPAALYAMASSYSEKGYNATARALIAKADALSKAKAHGADDDELFAQMMAATGATNDAATAVSTPYNPAGGPKFG